MDCGCSVSFYDDCEESSWGVREVARAGKDHKCLECGGVIKKGSPFFYHTLFYDGGIGNYKVCPDCQSVIWQFFSNGWMFGTVWESLEDYLWENWADDLPSSCITKLTPAARDKVCDIFEQIHLEHEK